LVGFVVGRKREDLCCLRNGAGGGGGNA
jgi:hypothetical protein